MSRLIYSVGLALVLGCTACSVEASDQHFEAASVRGQKNVLRPVSEKLSALAAQNNWTVAQKEAATKSLKESLAPKVNSKGIISNQQWKTALKKLMSTSIGAKANLANTQSISMEDSREAAHSKTDAQAKDLKTQFYMQAGEFINKMRHGNGQDGAMERLRDLAIKLASQHPYGMSPSEYKEAYSKMEEEFDACQAARKAAQRSHVSFSNSNNNAVGAPVSAPVVAAPAPVVAPMPAPVVAPAPAPVVAAPVPVVAPAVPPAPVGLPPVPLLVPFPPAFALLDGAGNPMVAAPAPVVAPAVPPAPAAAPSSSMWHYLPWLTIGTALIKPTFNYVIKPMVLDVLQGPGAQSLALSFGRSVVSNPPVELAGSALSIGGYALSLLLDNLLSATLVADARRIATKAARGTRFEILANTIPWPIVTTGAVVLNTLGQAFTQIMINEMPYDILRCAGIPRSLMSPENLEEALSYGQCLKLKAAYEKDIANRLANTTYLSLKYIARGIGLDMLFQVGGSWLWNKWQNR